MSTHDQYPQNPGEFLATAKEAKMKGSAGGTFAGTYTVADLLIIPIQMNYDGSIGPAEDGRRVRQRGNFVLAKPRGLGNRWTEPKRDDD